MLYEWALKGLGRFGYACLARPHKTVVLRYLEHTTGYSRQQLTRLVRRYLDCTTLAKRYRTPAHGFVRKFSPADVAQITVRQQEARPKLFSQAL